MSKQAHLADGTILDFPDETPDSVMDATVKRHIAQSSPAGTLGYKQETSRQTFESNKPEYNQLPSLGPLGSVVTGVGDFAAGLEKAVGLDPMHPIKSLPHVAKGMITAPMALLNPALSKAMGGPSGPLDLAKGVVSGVKDSGEGVYRGIKEDDPEKFFQSVGQLYGTVRPMAEPAKEISRAGVNAVTTPEALMTRAANNRTIGAPSATDMIPGRTGAIVRAAGRVYGKPAASLQESMARFAVEGRGGPPAALNTLEHEPLPPIERPGPVLSTTEGWKPGPAQLPEQPKVGAQLPSGNPLLDELRKQTAGENAPTDSAFVTESSRVHARPIRPPRELYDIPFKPPKDWEAPTPKPPTAMTSADVNRWMSVADKEVMSGSNPGHRILSEGLLGETKAATAVNVKAALADAGQQMEAHLSAATDKGATIDAKTPVDTAFSETTSKLNAPTDEAFTRQLESVRGKIEERYPGLDKLSPTDTHRLKVELGDAIDWNGTGYDAPINQAMIRIYRSLNSSIKAAAPEIGDIQSRWSDLYVGSKSLAKSAAKDVVGRGTGERPTVKPPKALQSKPSLKEDMKTKRFPLPL